MTYEVRTEKQRYWATQLEEAESSGQTLAEYARTHDLPIQSLYQWRSTLKAQSCSEAVSPHHFTQVMTTKSSCVLLVEINSVLLRFDQLPDVHWLSTLMCAQSPKP